MVCLCLPVVAGCRAQGATTLQSRLGEQAQQACALLGHLPMVAQRVIRRGLALAVDLGECGVAATAIRRQQARELPHGTLLGKVAKYDNDNDKFA